MPLFFEQDRDVFGGEEVGPESFIIAGIFIGQIFYSDQAKGFIEGDFSSGKLKRDFFQNFVYHKV